MFDKTRNQMNNCRWYNLHSFGDQVDHTNPQNPPSGMLKRTGERFTWYCSDDLRAKIEPPNCQQYKPGVFLSVRPLYWDEIIDEDHDDLNWADPGAPSGGRSRPGDGNDNDDCEREEDTLGGAKGIRKMEENNEWEGEREGNGGWEGAREGEGERKW
jgi:hypothetical protein